MPDNSVSPAKLKTMHPALVGGGEWAASGHPQGQNPLRNALAGGPGPSPMGNLLTGSGQQAQAPNRLMAASAPQPSMNLLTQAPLAPPPIPAPPLSPAAAPVSAPQQPLTPSPTQASSIPDRQEQHRAVAKHLGIEKMTDAELTERLARFSYMRSVLRNLLESDHLDHADVVAAMAQAVRDGVVPQAELPAMMTGITNEPTKLRAEMLARYKVTMHGLVAMAGEEHRRTMDGAK